MKKELVNKALSYTSEFVEKFWHKDISILNDYLDENVIVIGMAPNQFVHGKKLTLEIFEDMVKYVTKCEVIKQELYPAFNDQHTLTIIGQYVIKSSNDKGIYYQTERISIMWNSDLKIIHMHLSVAIDQKDSSIPRGVEHIDYSLSDVDEKHLHLKDENKNLLLIPMLDIEYASALGHDTLVYLKHKVIHAKVSWREFMDMLDDRFIQVHRSYIIQKDCVKLIARNYLVMNSGAKIPVPIKNMKTVLLKLTERDHNEDIIL